VLLLLSSSVIALSAIVAAFLWARWLRRRAVAPRVVARAANSLLAIAAFAPVASCAMTIVTLNAVASEYNGSLGTVSVAIFSGPILLAGAAALILALLVLIGATAWWHWVPRSPAPKGDPPYR
jgi:hypothetical protein